MRDETYVVTFWEEKRENYGFGHELCPPLVKGSEYSVYIKGNIGKYISCYIKYRFRCVPKVTYEKDKIILTGTDENAIGETHKVITIRKITNFYKRHHKLSPSKFWGDWRRCG